MDMSNYLSTTSFKAFEDIPGASIFERAKAQSVYLNNLRDNGYMNYRLLVTSGCGPTVDLAAEDHLKAGNYVSFVCNDYLGFTQHPRVKQAVLAAIEKYGTGAGASPLIGGYFEYHKIIEDKLSEFFSRPKAQRSFIRQGIRPTAPLCNAYYGSLISPGSLTSPLWTWLYMPACMKGC